VGLCLFGGKMKKIFLIVILSLITNLSFAADTINLRFSARVEVQVSDLSPDDNLKDTVSSYIKEELRSLNDVKLVDTNPEWEIDIMATRVTTSKGYKPRVAFSIVTFKPFDNWMLSPLLQPKYRDYGLKLISALSSSIEHSMRLDSIDNLQEMCKEIVAHFDSNQLEKSRKSFREMKEKLQKSN
jgi:uncharacterized membrane protein YheB (UPF0754 family)